MLWLELIEKRKEVAHCIEKIRALADESNQLLTIFIAMVKNTRKPERGKRKAES
jgi:hypothetical protein